MPGSISNIIAQTEKVNRVIRGQGSPVAFKDWFTWIPEFSVFRGADGSYFSDLEIDDYDTIGGVTYYLSPTGDDGNDGLSQTAPKKSVEALISTVNALAVEEARFQFAPGNYTIDEGSAHWNGTAPNFNVSMRCPDGRALVAAVRFATIYAWSTNVTYPLVYQATASNVKTAFESKKLDNHGLSTRMVGASSLEECSTLPGSFFRSGSTVYIRTFDDREPDDLTLLSFNGARCLFNKVNGIFFAENMFFGSGSNGFDLNVEGNVFAYFKQCGFVYSNGNGLSADCEASGRVYLIDCIAAQNTADGFNYHDSGSAFEERCIAYNNGTEKAGSNGSANGSTCHDNFKSIRINCDYFDNKNRNIHDVGLSQNLIFGCRVGGGTLTIEKDNDSCNIAIGLDSTNEATRTAVLDCRLTGKVPYDLIIFNPDVVAEIEGTDIRTAWIEKQPVIIGASKGYSVDWVKLTDVSLSATGTHLIFTPNEGERFIADGPAFFLPVNHDSTGKTIDADIQIDNGTDDIDSHVLLTVVDPVDAQFFEIPKAANSIIFDSSSPIRLRITQATNISLRGDITIPVKRLN